MKTFEKGQTVWWVDPFEYLCTKCTYVGATQSQGDPAHHIELPGCERSFTVTGGKVFDNKADALHEFICILGSRISTFDMQVLRLRHEQQPYRTKYQRSQAELKELTGGRDG